MNMSAWWPPLVFLFSFLYPLSPSHGLGHPVSAASGVIGEAEGREKPAVLGETHEARGSTRLCIVPLKQREDVRTVGMNAVQLSGDGGAVTGLWGGGGR